MTKELKILILLKDTRHIFGNFHCHLNLELDSKGLLVHTNINSLATTQKSKESVKNAK